jgi:hypothetical protein
MPIPLRRAIEPSTPLAFNGYSDFRLPRGMAHNMAILQFSGGVTLSAGTSVAVRSRGVPIKQIQLLADNGVIPHVIKGMDTVLEAETYGQIPLGQMYNAPAGSSLSTLYSFTGAVPLYFSEPFAGSLAWRYTALPSWAFTGECIVRVYWGDATDLFSGSGVVGALSTPSAKLLLLSSDKWDAADATAADFTSRFQMTYKSFTEVAVSNGSNVTVDVPRTEDCRSIVLVTLDANGNPADSILSNVTLEENNSVQRVANALPIHLSVDTARAFLGTRPSGVYVIEFADDQDLSSILRASALDQFQLKITAAATGTLRVYTRRVGLPKR